jgi:hypothetical protein
MKNHQALSSSLIDTTKDQQTNATTCASYTSDGLLHNTGQVIPTNGRKADFPNSYRKSLS